ncbi:protein-serine O-palmitoleoyltransferase porcupine [Eurosta solidaginis]|uniref:protein-serine O-palmitoleoyltransferase porcupine n=1 Tax=Eurosta solidaginis TaxID=178769 RepID=UPI0035315071
MSYYYYNYDDDDEQIDVDADYDAIFEENQPIFEWESLYETCILPSTLQISWYISVLLGWSLIGHIGITICSRLKTKGDWLIHTISILTGYGVLIMTVGKKSYIVVGITVVSFIILHLIYQFEVCKRNIGFIMLLFILSTHLSYELIWKRQMAWEVIQGPIMITNMKTISIAFEMEESTLMNRHVRVFPSVFSFFGYIFMPTNLIIGPWVPYSTYLYSIRTDPLRRLCRRWIMWCFLCSIISLSFLNLSNCIVPLVFTERSPIWLRIFRDALSVRCSHYFVSFLSQASIAIGGITLSKYENPNAYLGYMITQPLQIEFPRSLSTVVRTWNLPTHCFLKEYIFRRVYRRFGSHLIAIFATYLVSSLLHGEYLKIYLVLLSLASFAYVEYKLRDKVANAFNACVSANMCRKPCRFKFCPSHGWLSDGAILVILTNVLFSLLTIFHLAYLGAIMTEATVEDEPESIGFFDDLNLWSSVSYVNHWTALFTFFLYLVS